MPLLHLINGTGVDEAANEEDAADTASDKTAAEDSAAATDSTPADDQQVNAEAPATRLVNAERPSRRRHGLLYVSLRLFRLQISLVITTKFCT